MYLNLKNHKMKTIDISVLLKGKEINGEDKDAFIARSIGMFIIDLSKKIKLPIGASELAKVRVLFEKDGSRLKPIIKKVNLFTKYHGGGVKALDITNEVRFLQNIDSLIIQEWSIQQQDIWGTEEVKKHICLG